MNERDAIRWAMNRARKRNCEIFVIWSVEDIDPPGQHYHTATEFELETYYNGTSENNVRACVQPDGTIEGRN